MASQEKLVKALEALRLSMLNTQNTDLTAKKKDKISNCLTATEILCNTNIKTVPNFPNLLSATIEVLLQLCDDHESDVRMMADECLNRIIRAMCDTHIAKIQVELHNEIKKNSSARTLRAALIRFAQLCHMIRPHKGKLFVQILVPCIVKIAARDEESVLETLEISLQRIMLALGCFATDGDVKSLLRAFLVNISHNSAVVRRTAANSLLTICLNCRKPHTFTVFVLNHILDLVIPVHENVTVAQLLGVFGTLRCLIQHINVDDDKNYQIQDSFGDGSTRNNTKHLYTNNTPVLTHDCDRFIEIYELCLYYMTHNDHNVINAALETLNTLLTYPSEQLLTVLLSTNGVGHSRIMNGNIKKMRSISEMSVAASELPYNIDDSLLISDKLTASDVEQWIETSKLSHKDIESVTLTPQQSSDCLSLNNYYDEQNDNDKEQYNNLFIQNLNDNCSEISECTTNQQKSIDIDIKEATVCDKISIKSDKSIQTESDLCVLKDLDIGEFIDNEITLIYCCRHLIKSFLLTGYNGKLITDQLVRVSVKSLALTCLARVFQLYPNSFLLYLDKFDGCQPISDVILYAHHSDPQIRGIVRILLASLIKAVLNNYNADYNFWLRQFHIDLNHRQYLNLNHLIDIINKGLTDESSTCIKQSLSALTICLTNLLESVNSQSTIPLLNTLPILVKNPYWLVQVQLVEVLQDLPYVTIYHVTKNTQFQDKVLHSVLYYLLANDDLRVRHSAANTFLRIIPNLYFAKDHPQTTPITIKAIEYRLKYMHTLFDFNSITPSTINQQYFIASMPTPYSALNNLHLKQDHLELILSRIITDLEIKLLQSNSKYLTFGCCETLALLSTTFPTTIYAKAWNCVNYSTKKNTTKISTTPPASSSYQRGNQLQNVDIQSLLQLNDLNLTRSSSLFQISVAMLSQSILSEDISCQTWLLTLAGNLFSGLSIQNLKSSEQLLNHNNESNQPRKNWDIYFDTIFIQTVDQLMIHVIKLMNIFTYVLDEIQPILPTAKSTTIQTALPSLPNTSNLTSPIKRKSKTDLIDKNKLISPVKILTDKDDKNEKRLETSRLQHSMGYFANNPHYMKIYDILKTAFGNYKLTLDESASEKFLLLLKTVLYTLSQLLEMCTIQECGRIADEVLQYLQSCVNYEPACSIQCVQQLLKSLFGTNLCTQLDDLDIQIHKKYNKVSNNNSVNIMDVNSSFYANIFQRAYTKFTTFLNTMNMNKHSHNDKDIECASLISGGSSSSTTSSSYYMRRKSSEQRRTSLTLKSLTRGADKTSLANYIRLFEPMVIKSLKQYTVTSDVYLQCKVLQLLCQLVQLRVNYCLLDSDQIFIGFVLKQFEYIEEGQMPHADELIPKIFQFLVHLSYENQHSKSIIVIPKVINLCDGLMASGQSPLTHCIPALKPVIYDVFLLRTSINSTTNEIKELETTRDVLFSMLLRLVEYAQVLDMLAMILADSRQYTDNGERWSKWSKLVIDSLVPMLMQRRVRLETRDAQLALHSLFVQLHPNVYKAMEPLLMVLFQEPPCTDVSLTTINRWLGAILSILLIISAVREDILLFKIKDIRIDIPLRSIYKKLIENYDPLNVTQSSQSIFNILPEEVFARFIFRIVFIVGEHCLILNNQQSIYLYEQFTTFLLFCIHMFESGSHCKIANKAMYLVHEQNMRYNDNFDNNKDDDTDNDANFIPIDDINKIFLKLSPFVPILTFQWCYILTLLGYSNQKYWSQILQNVENDKIIHLESEKLQNKRNFNCINTEIVRIGGIIAYSDYICENINDCENLTWFLVNHIETVINLSNEPPVAELVAAIHRNNAASGLFVQAVAARCQQFDQPNFVNKLLKCLENVHPSQSGPLLVFLVQNLLNCRQLALSRLNAGLASRRTEMLLTMSIDDVTSQLSKDDLTTIMDILLERKLAKKHSTFVSLLNKLASKYYDLSPLELDHGRTVNAESIRQIQTNKVWYLSQVKLRCCQTCYLGGESAELLNHLPYDDIVNIMTQKEFNRLILKDCISLILNMDVLLIDEQSPLLKATVEMLLKQIVYIKSLMPKPHQVYNASNGKYTNRLNELFTDQIFWMRFFEIIPTVTEYLKLITVLEKPIQLPEQHYEDLIKFSVLSLECIVYLIERDDGDFNSIELALECANQVLKQQFLTNILALDTYSTWLCSAINALHTVVNWFLLNHEPMPILSRYGLQKSFDTLETQSAATACYQISTLIAWLEQQQQQQLARQHHPIPATMFQLIKSLIVSLARLPLVNSYVLTPPDVWTDQMWNVGLLGGTFNTQVPPIPIEFLQEIDILEQFIFRITLLGWTSRQQFEETWMCLLSVLSSDNISEHIDDITLKTQANSLAVQAITTLLMQTMLLPIPGHPNYSHYLHVPRERILNQNQLNTKKLINVQNKLSKRYKQCRYLPSAEAGVVLINIFDRPNLDKLYNDIEMCTYGQVSIEYIWTAANMLQQQQQQQQSSANDKVNYVIKKRQQCLLDGGFDIHSCIQFLLDLYTQWIRSVNSTPLRLLVEVVRSILAISDLFTEKSHFQWMFDVCMDLSKRHPCEDEILHQYLVLGVCKSAAVLIPDMDTYESVKRLVETSLKSNALSERIAGLHGILYLLQSGVMSNTVIGGMSDEISLIHPIAVDYIQNFIINSKKSVCYSDHHRQVIWALAFYLLEHVEDQIGETEIIPSVLQVIMILLSQNSHNLSMVLHNTLLQGLERLIISKNITGNVVEQVTKLAVERLKHTNPAFAFPALQLLLTCMYTEGEKQLNAPENINGIVEMDPDLLVDGIEKISAIFDRIKKGYPFEAELLCTVLSHLLIDFFPPSEILTKVISEFLSPQQPHPRLLSNVVFQIFERAIEQNQLTLLQDWVVFSLSNFTQSLPIGMATWCLICFFISASTNRWLRALFPHVQSRIGKYEYEDKKMLCVTGVDFYKQLINDAQKQKFIDTFQSVVDSTPGTPFKDLLQSLL